MIVLLLSLLLGQAHATNPAWSFNVLTSPHFELIYRSDKGGDQKELAKRYILAAEQAHELLFPIFKESPARTIILLKDDADGSNGLANFLPYPHITVYPVLPSTLDSVDEYGDWAFEMMLHEYTHILNMYPAHGIYVPLKWIFGTVVRPNAVLPRWWLEGLAVNLESSLSDHGRLKSSETSGSARALILMDKFKDENVSRINEAGLSSWPHGGRPYLYGAWWWDQAQREKGFPVIDIWNQNYSRRLPFFLNGPVLEQTTKTPDQFLRHTLDTITETGKKQIEAIEAAGKQSGVTITEEKGEQNIFAVSPDGNRLLYWLSRPGAGSEVRMKTRSEEKKPFHEIESERLFKAVGGLRVHWMTNDRFVFDQIDIKYPYGSYRDLWTYDIHTKEKRRLTTQARAQEPGPSPKGDKIAFIQNEGGRNRLMLLDMNDFKIRSLLIGNLYQRLSWPEFINDNDVVFSVRQKSGREKLHMINVRSKKVSPFNETLSSAQNSRFTSEGLFVTDALTNARNVYQIKNGSVQARSNTLTDIQTVDFDPQRRELIVSELTGEGRRIKAIPFENYNPPKLEQPKWETAPKPLTTKVKVEEESFSPLSYMLPRYWIPFIYQVEDGLIFQGMTANQDPLGRNQYTLNASFDTVTDKPSYGFSYANSSTPVGMGLGYNRSVSYLGASGLVVESQAAAVSLIPEWPFYSRFVNLSLGAGYGDTKRGAIEYKRLGPTASIEYSRLQNPLNERFGYHAELRHTEYIEQDDYLKYARTYAHVATQATVFGKQRVFFQARGALAPQQPTNTIVDLGDRNVGGNYLINLANSNFLLRGYPSGTFVGRKIVNANLEYALPLTDFDKGFGTFPVFLRGLELAFFTDMMAVDGAGYDQGRARYVRTSMSENYVGSGAELRLNTTSLYHLPLSLTFGLYYGFNDRFGGGLSPFFGFGFGGLNPLENKTP